MQLLTSPADLDVTAFGEAEGDAMRRRVVGLALLGLYLLVVLLDARRIGHLTTGDTNNLVNGTFRALECLSQGKFVECGYFEGTIRTTVHPFPLLQYLVAAPLVAFGLQDAATVRWLGLVSWFAVAGVVATVIATFRTRPRLAALVLVSILASSYMYQATSAFGEALSAAVVVGAICAAIRRRPGEIFLLVLLASLGKETLAPFVVVLVLVCARSDEDRWLPRKQLTIAAVSAGAVAMLINSAFNIFRYGSIGNRLYLDPSLRTPGLARKLDFAAAILVSPTGGILWYWPVFSLLAIVATGIGLRRLVRSPHAVRSHGPVLVVSLVTLGWLVSVSAWYTPFGWIAYGPRLQVPLLGGLAVAFAHLVGDGIVSALQRSRRAVCIAATAIAVGAIQFGAPWRWPTAIEHLVAPNGACPMFGESNLMANPGQFYDCTDALLWRVHPFILGDIVDLSPTIGGSAWLLGLAGSLYLLRYVSANHFDA